MTTKQAFAEMISKRGWYKNLGVLESTAAGVAKRFRDGAVVTVDKMEELLIKAGYRVVKEKQWAHLPGLVDPAPVEHETVPLVDRPENFFSDFIGWNYLHSHMYPPDSTFDEQVGYYDVYLRKVKIQEQENKL